jgi:hypothetical protein
MDAGAPEPPDPGIRRAAPGLVVILALLVGCATGTRGSSDDSEHVDPSVFDTPVERADPPKKRPAVTQIGREILPRTGMVVRGRTQRLSNVRGTEVARFEVEEVLRSVPWDQLPDAVGSPILTVFCGEPGMLPRVGVEALLLVARRVRSPNHDVVQVVPIAGSGGAERLAAYKAYLEIESVQSEEERVEALRSYLHRAVRDSRRWTRDNAALEFGSLARFRPYDLGSDDVGVLRNAAMRSNSAVVQRSLQTALAVAERNNTRAPRVPVPEVPNEELLAPFTVSYGAATDPADRRKIVLEAAVELEAGAAPLLRVALDDEDARVREAAVASAGQLRITAVGDALLPLLSREEPLPVRRSTVRAIGHLRVADAVPSLAILARGEGELGSDACYALGRIRTSEAITAMGQLLAGATGERLELIEYLLTDAFVEQERALGRPID